MNVEKKSRSDAATRFRGLEPVSRAKVNVTSSRFSPGSTAGAIRIANCVKSTVQIDLSLVAEWKVDRYGRLGL
jgi:hypothetical protein